MAKDKLTEYDATAANNTVVGDVNLAENSALPSDMNNAVREVMSHQKEAFGSGTPLYVDQTNNRLGVGTTSPTRNISISDTVPYINLVGSTTSAIGMLLGDTDAEIRGALLYDNNADRINLRAGGNTTRVSIDSDGLKFGSDTAATNALDDYEEGSWTPVLTREGGTLSISYSEQRGRYTKVGRIVCAQFRLQANITAGDLGARFMGGLPYANVNAGGDTGSGCISPFGGFGGQNYYSVSGHMVNNSASFRFKVQANLDQANTDWSGGTGAVIMDGTFTYTASS